MKNIEFRLLLDSDFKIAVFGARLARLASVSVGFFLFFRFLTKTQKSSWRQGLRRLVRVQKEFTPDLLPVDRMKNRSLVFAA